MSDEKHTSGFDPLDAAVRAVEEDMKRTPATADFLKRTLDDALEDAREELDIHDTSPVSDAEIETDLADMGLIPRKRREK